MAHVEFTQAARGFGADRGEEAFNGVLRELASRKAAW